MNAIDNYFEIKNKNALMAQISSNFGIKVTPLQFDILLAIEFKKIPTNKKLAEYLNRSLHYIVNSTVNMVGKGYIKRINKTLVVSDKMKEILKEYDKYFY